MFQIDYRYLRPKKAEALKRWYAEDFPQRDSLDIWQGQNATILPLVRESGLLFGRGGVVDQDGNYIPLSGVPGRVWGAYPTEDIPFEDKKVVYCGYMVNHWGHFLVEAVARLWYYLRNDSTVEKYIFFLNQDERREIRGNYREFFELLGIWDKLEFINKPTKYREVLIPELAFHYHDYYSPDFLDIFNTVAANVSVDPNWEIAQKIYFSRSQLKKGMGMEFGLELLDNFFSKNGYTILYPEKVPLSRMIHYIRNCDTLATLSGSLPHNMLFACPGQKLVVIERTILNNDFQTYINRMRELQATNIDANIGIYPVDMCGPFIMACNDILKRYAADNGMLLPDSRFQTKAYRDQCFKKYMRAYQDMYRYQWFMADWYSEFADYLVEAYTDGASYFQEYLDGSKPCLPENYFQFHYFKQFVKSIIRKIHKTY